jgi:hypothetical protein
MKSKRQCIPGGQTAVGFPRLAEENYTPTFQHIPASFFSMERTHSPQANRLEAKADAPIFGEILASIFQFNRIIA